MIRPARGRAFGPQDMTKRIKIAWLAMIGFLGIALIAAYLHHHGIPPASVRTDADRTMLVEALGILPSASPIYRYEIRGVDYTCYYRFTTTGSEYLSIITNGWHSGEGSRRRRGPIWWRPPEKSDDWTFDRRVQQQYGELIRNKKSGMTYFLTFHE
jgi:hypothetical protein